MTLELVLPTIFRTREYSTSTCTSYHLSFNISFAFFLSNFHFVIFSLVYLYIPPNNMCRTSPLPHIVIPKIASVIPTAIYHSFSSFYFISLFFTLFSFFNGSRAFPCSTMGISYVLNTSNALIHPMYCFSFLQSSI